METIKLSKSVLNVTDKFISVNGVTYNLLYKNKEFELLLYLFQNPVIFLNRNEILESIWGSAEYNISRVMDTLVCQVRKKLKRDTGLKLETKRTIKGATFRLDLIEHNEEYHKTKQCKKCLKFKPLADFHICRKMKDGKKNECKVCTSSERNNIKPAKVIEHIDGEIWKDIIGYKGLYQVSNLGRVKSCIYYVKYKNTTRRNNPGLLKPTINNGGYYTVNLKNKEKDKTIPIHRIVALAFIPNLKNKEQVNHINCIKTDNRVENLEWCTRQENIDHAVRNNLIGKGESSSNSKLTNKDVLEIRNKYQRRGYFDSIRLASDYNVKPNTINGIINRRVWRHI